jgi:catechol 2,3-dioxygenase-like lactoylglutathione lyase family enzyme
LRQAPSESEVANGKQAAHLDHLTILVRDAERSRTWYTTVLGLRIEFELPSPRAVALQDSGGFGLFLEQRPEGDFQPSCVLTFRVEDVDALARKLRAAGVTFSAQPQKLFWGYGAELRDPDGYLVRLWDEQSMKEKGG